MNRPDTLRDQLVRRWRTITEGGDAAHLPTFAIIGTMKGGTSSLHYYLRHHPQVVMSHTKETNFFQDPEHGGHDLDWYLDQFRGEADQYGEASPNYTKRHSYPGVAERMHAALPGLKLIFLARDPLERAISNYLHNVGAGRRSLEDFRAFFDRRNSPIVKTSMYHWQLEPWVEHYGMERILVMASEHLLGNRTAALREVFDFLEIDRDVTSPAFEEIRHPTAKKLQRAGRGDGADAAGESVADRADPGSPSRPELTPEQRRRVTEQLAPDLERFRALTGQDFAHWSV